MPHWEFPEMTTVTVEIPKWIWDKFVESTKHRPYESVLPANLLSTFILHHVENYIGQYLVMATRLAANHPLEEYRKGHVNWRDNICKELDLFDSVKRKYDFALKERQTRESHP